MNGRGIQTGRDSSQKKHYRELIVQELANKRHLRQGSRVKSSTFALDVGFTEVSEMARGHIARGTSPDGEC